MEIWSRKRPRTWSLDARRRAWTWAAAAVVAALYTGAVFGLGGCAQQRGFFGQTLRPLLATNVAAVPRWISGLTARAEHVDLDVKQVHMDTLRAVRAKALRAGVLIRQGDDWVPARARWRGNDVRVNLRLKGDWVQGQLDSPKWSFRLKAKGEGRLFGMREFSLHHPQARNYLYEWIYQRALARSDILALRYQFITASLNGKDLGVYALEEHFDHLLVEANRRREGPILHFNEEALWADRGAHGKQWDSSPTGIQSWFSSTIDAFNLNRLKASPGLYREFLAARQRLEDFRRGARATSEVFDVTRLARFFALSELLGATHGAGIWHNLRFYFNPVLGRLEPIGFDGDAGHEIDRVLIDPDAWDPGSGEFHARLFEDRAFVRAYVRALEEVSADGYLETLLRDLEPEMQRAVRVLYREWPAYRFEPEIFSRNRQVIRSVLHPAKLLDASGRPSQLGKMELRLEGVQMMPVEVLEVLGPTSRTTIPDMMVPGKRQGEPGAEQTIRVAAGSADSLPEPELFRVRCRLEGSSAVREEPVHAWAPLGVECVWKEFGQQARSLAAHDLLTVDEARRTIAFRPGRWPVRQTLILPAGYTVLAGPGTELDLRDEAVVVSFSPLRWIGTEASPVVVGSGDRSGRGLLVIAAQDASILSHVEFHDLANPDLGNCGITSAVTFYESPVQFSHVLFATNHCEDALNVLRTHFTMVDCRFVGTSADAFDVDFGRGSLRRVSFLNCGNDAFDVSGSRVDVRDILVDGAGDKALSAGERSVMEVQGADIRNAEIGAAAKDDSELRISGIRMKDCALGFAVFQKKPEFGPATLVVNRFEVADLRTTYLLEKGSSFTLDGERQQSNESRVRGLLYGVKYGKASR